MGHPNAINNRATINIQFIQDKYIDASFKMETRPEKQKKLYIHEIVIITIYFVVQCFPDPQDIQQCPIQLRTKCNRR